MIAQEIKKKTSIDVPYGTLMDILNEIPLVTQATTDEVSFSNGNEVEQAPEEEAKDQVADMASGGGRAIAPEKQF